MFGGLLAAWTALQGAMQAVSAYRFVKGASKMFGAITGMSWIKIGSAVVLVLIVGGSVYGFWKQYNTLVSDNAQLTADLAVKDLALATQNATIDAQSDALDEWVQFQSDLELKLQELSDGKANARAIRDELVDFFDGSDLQLELDTAPDETVSRINRRTSTSNRLLECASGAKGADCAGRNAQTTIDVGPETGTD